MEPVVKADAYGHGAVLVARTLVAAGADGLSVATFDEAVELRDAGVEGPIQVLYGTPPEVAREAAEREITLTVGERAALDELLAAAARWDPAPAVPLALQLELETGLGRDGIALDEAVEAASAIVSAAHVRLAGIWTHLQAPADPAHTRPQVERFDDALGRLRDARLDPGVRHIAASGGLFAGVPAYDAIRPGLAIYGVVPEGMPRTEAAATLAAALRPVLALRARAVRVADLPAGWGISYGPSFETSRPSRIATLPLGYGDGWARASSNRADALVRGVRVPIVGTVSMDAVMVDVTDVPGRPVGRDDEFTLIGADGADRITAAEVARSRTTISYEVVTAMARRLPRVYHSAAGPGRVRTLGPTEESWLASNSGTATSATSRSMRS